MIYIYDHKSKSRSIMKQEVTKRLPAEKERVPSTHPQCAVIATLKLFATKWKPCIICYLMETPKRYNELFRIIPNISRKILSEHLAELVRDHLIVRTQYDPKMQRVEYGLSEKGRTLLPLITQIQDWGLLHLHSTLSVNDMIGKPTIY